MPSRTFWYNNFVLEYRNSVIYFSTYLLNSWNYTVFRSTDHCIRVFDSIFSPFRMQIIQIFSSRINTACSVMVVVCAYMHSLDVVTHLVQHLNSAFSPLTATHVKVGKFPFPWMDSHTNSGAKLYISTI